MHLIIEIYSFYFIGIIYAFIFSFLTNNKITIQIVFTKKVKQNFSVSIYGFKSQGKRQEENGNHCERNSFLFGSGTRDRFHCTSHSSKSMMWNTMQSGNLAVKRVRNHCDAYI